MESSIQVELDLEACYGGVNVRLSNRSFGAPGQGLAYIRAVPVFMNQITIRASGLTRQFSSVRALDDLTIEVPAGVVFGFLGPTAP